MKPLSTVDAPPNNRAEYIEQSMLSVLEQDYPIRWDKLEVVVMSNSPLKLHQVHDVVIYDSLPGIPDPLPNTIPLCYLDLILGGSDRELESPIHDLEADLQYGWRYCFQKADLQHQRGDWDEVARLADMASVLEDRPNDASERLPLIEVYAQVARWDDTAIVRTDVVREQRPMWRTAVKRS